MVVIIVMIIIIVAQWPLLGLTHVKTDTSLKTPRTHRCESTQAKFAGLVVHVFVIFVELGGFGGKK